MFTDETVRQDAEKVAHGGQPQWAHTAKHRIYGDLSFTAKMPNATGLTAQSLRMDELLSDLPEGVAPRMGTMRLVAARAGIATLVTLPVIREETLDDDEDSGHKKVVQHLYDPDTEIDEQFLAEVWEDYSNWRSALLDAIDQVKAPSARTNGSGSDASSTSPTEPPQETPASTGGPTPTTSES